MQATEHFRNSYARERSIFPGLVLMAFALSVAGFFLLFSTGSFDSYQYLYLVPWLSGLALVMAVPMIVLFYQGRFTFVDPLVFATLSYFFPAFVVGGLFFAVGLSQPSFSNLIQDARTTLPLTVVLIGLGYAGLAFGYMLPIGKKVGTIASRWLPVADYSPRSLIFPSILLLLSGMLITFFTLILGRFGYQRAADFGTYDGLIFFTTLFWAQAAFVLWSIIFRHKKLDFVFFPIILLLALTSLTKFLYSGSRGNIIQVFLIVTFAFIFSGRRFSIKQGAVAGFLLTLGLTVGMIYGTTFRNVKGNEESVSAEKYTENVFQTVDEVGKNDVYDTLIFGAVNFTERVDVLSTLAVVVSTYEQLAPYEEAYGLDNNIWVEMTTFMIPRVVWPDKPVVSDARKYSDLYFNYGGSSYAVTPIGDLLRNYGIIGVPIGMFLLGLLLRVAYCSLAELQNPPIWRLTLYFMLLTSVSYEGFYGTIIPVLFKIGLTAVVGIVFVNAVAKRIDRGRLTQQVRS